MKIIMEFIQNHSTLFLIGVGCIVFFLFIRLITRKKK